MTSIRALNTDSQMRQISEEDLSGLCAKIKGRILLPSDSDYNGSRKLWNDMIDRKPAFIVQCSKTEDIILSVTFAKNHNLLVSVKGAGHNIAGRALQDDVMLIDLSNLRDVKVNVNDKTATIQPGATLGDVDKATQAYGLALPVGINSTTGIAGLTLGGGFGWISRRYGLTIDSLISAEVITTAGERIRCDHKNHSDLFWAVCGGGGNFGIVTEFEFNLHPIPPEAMAGPMVFSIEEAETVLMKYRDLCKQMSDEFTVWAVLRKAPPFPFLDEQYHGETVLILACMHSGSLAESKKEIEKLRALGAPLADAIGPLPFVDFQQAFDPLLTPGARNYWKTHNFKEISDDLIKVLVNSARDLPNTLSEIFLAQLGGQINLIPIDATSYPHRDISFVMNVHTRWDDKKEDEKSISWAREFYKATKPFATGSFYVNFVSEGDDSVEQAYGENAKRLSKIKAKYDPKNVLRANLNILPDK